MKPISIIRQRLGVTQAALAVGIGVTQGNVSHYERGQTIPPDVARRLIDFARSHGLSLTFDQIYAPELEAARQEVA
ncbi:helix-turn-helix domain-containing protein [Bordetella bronchiseptica]|uniref:helix-turn-helix domain-containing protein n=1 Tax=Bordetella bronchiseptica TaxID=518 RepID=UPI000C1A0F44|nr:helix-turn-helix transcriptional regulator [Bordetella bronchiseptica]